MEPESGAMAFNPVSTAKPSIEIDARAVASFGPSRACCRHRVHYRTFQKTIGVPVVLPAIKTGTPISSWPVGIGHGKLERYDDETRYEEFKIN